MDERKIKPQFISVPFSGDSPNGIMHYNGIAKFSAAGIVIEFDSKFLGLVGGEVKEVRLQLDDILDIRLRRGVFRFFAQIQIRLQNFSLLAALPNDDGKVKLNIKRGDHALATRAVEQTLRYLNENETAFLQGDGETNDQLPPAPTSVSELFDTEKLEKKDSRVTNELPENTNR